MLRFVTDFADQAVVLPVAIAVGLALLPGRRWRLALLWAVAVGGVLGAMLVAKLAGQACGWLVPAFGPGALDLVNPSGHAASAAVLGGCGAALLAERRGSRPVMAAAAGGAVALVAVVGVTRVLLGAHSVSEVAAGGMVGIAGAVGFGALAGAGWARDGRADRGGAGRGRGWAGSAALAGLLVAVLAHGRHLAAEPTIHGTAVGLIRRELPACQPPAGLDVDGWRGRRTDDGE